MLGNWIRETTTTTGTGNLTVSSVSGYPTFNNHFGTSRPFRYTILDDSTGAPIECGIGHLSGTTTLVRDYVFATYVSGTYAEPNDTSSQVSLASGTKRVICSVDQQAPQQNMMRATVQLNATANNRLVIADNIIAAPASNLTITVNRLYAWPVFLPYGGPYDAFATRPNGSGDIDVAIYSLGADGLPGMLLHSLVNQTVASGMNYSTISAFELKPGWYCFALNSDTATGFYQATLKEGYGRSDVSVQVPNVYLTQTQGTLPNPFGAPTVIGNLAAVPNVALRLS